MLKVFGFVRRHPGLTHDEYRAAHVGYHTRSAGGCRTSVATCSMCAPTGRRKRCWVRNCWHG